MLAQFAAEGFTAAGLSLSYDVDIRFQGQASEIRLPLPAKTATTITASEVEALQELFKSEHERLYGHRSDPDNPIEVVAVRLVGRALLHEQAQGPLKPAERLDNTQPQASRPPRSSARPRDRSRSP